MQKARFPTSSTSARLDGGWKKGRSVQDGRKTRPSALSDSSWTGRMSRGSDAGRGDARSVRYRQSRCALSVRNEGALPTEEETVRTRMRTGPLLFLDEPCAVDGPVVHTVQEDLGQRPFAARQAPD